MNEFLFLVCLEIIFSINSLSLGKEKADLELEDFWHKISYLDNNLKKR